MLPQLKVGSSGTPARACRWRKTLQSPSSTLAACSRVCVEASNHSCSFTAPVTGHSCVRTLASGHTGRRWRGGDAQAACRCRRRCSALCRADGPNPNCFKRAYEYGALLGRECGVRYQPGLSQSLHVEICGRAAYVLCENERSTINTIANDRSRTRHNIAQRGHYSDWGWREDTGAPILAANGAWAPFPIYQSTMPACCLQ
jgi:hypothetical protein